MLSRASLATTYSYTGINAAETPICVCWCWQVKAGSCPTLRGKSKLLGIIGKVSAPRSSQTSCQIYARTQTPTLSAVITATGKLGLITTLSSTTGDGVDHCYLFLSLAAYHSKGQSWKSTPALHQVSQGSSHQAVACTISVHHLSWDGWQVLSCHLGARGVKGAEGRTLGAHCQNDMLHACLHKVRHGGHVGYVEGGHVRCVEGGGRGCACEKNMLHACLHQVRHWGHVRRVKGRGWIQGICECEEGALKGQGVGPEGLGMCAVG